VVADRAFGSAALAEALGTRAGDGNIGIVLMAPLALEVPGWTDEAGERRDEVTGRMQATIGALGSIGIHAGGEVIDGDEIEAVKLAIRDHRATQVVVAVARGGRLDTASIVENLQAAAGDVPVERIVVDAEAPAAPSGS